MRVTIFRTSDRECKWEHFVHWCQNAIKFSFYSRHQNENPRWKAFSLKHVRILRPRCIHSLSFGRLILLSSYKRGNVCHMLILLDFQVAGLLNHDRVALKWMDAAVPVTRHYLWHVIPRWMNQKGDEGGDKCELSPFFFSSPSIPNNTVLPSPPPPPLPPPPPPPLKKKKKKNYGWRRVREKMKSIIQQPGSPCSSLLSPSTLYYD